MKPKIIALYLPQFHQIPENDEFWGKGFTDWVTVKNAKPLFKGHLQPRIPLNNNYYDLSIKENVAWQAKLAKEYGVYGFGIYHYWFNNEKNLLTKPSEIIRDNNDIDINYFFIWDNANWKRSWSNVYGNSWAPVADDPNKSGPQVLIPYILGEEPDWEKHYCEVATHFRNEKYIKHNNKPLFGIITFSKDILKMCEFWNERAKKDGYNGIEFIFQGDSEELPNNIMRYSYEPHYSLWINQSIFNRIYYRIISFAHNCRESRLYDYDRAWKRLLERVSMHPEKTFVPGAFVGYDDSPRRGLKGSKIVINNDPVKFELYMDQLVSIVEKQDKPYIFLTAWNEWGEGAYLEPDIINKYSYLSALKRITRENVISDDPRTR